MTTKKCNLIKKVILLSLSSGLIFVSNPAFATPSDSALLADEMIISSYENDNKSIAIMKVDWSYSEKSPYHNIYPKIDKLVSSGFDANSIKNIEYDEDRNIKITLKGTAVNDIDRIDYRFTKDEKAKEIFNAIDKFIRSENIQGENFINDNSGVDSNEGVSHGYGEGYSHSYGTNYSNSDYNSDLNNNKSSYSHSYSNKTLTSNKSKNQIDKKKIPKTYKMKVSINGNDYYFQNDDFIFSDGMISERAKALKQEKNGQ